MRAYTILIPHYKTGKMTAYCLSQIAKHSGGRPLEVIIINNSPEDGSEKYFNQITIPNSVVIITSYPKDLLQSHGAAFDFALANGNVSNEYFITLESDCFPVKDNWLDWYDEIIRNDGVCTGSILKLSGGTFLHPGGAMYKKSEWKQALQYSDFMNQFYYYLPNMGMKENFSHHLMIRKSAFPEFCRAPLKFGVELHDSYLTPDLYLKGGLYANGILNKAKAYEPMTKVFHNGLGSTQESINTYQARSIHTHYADALLTTKEDIIYRIGYEPGQWFGYWMMANGKQIFEIPTKVVWMPNRENQQQEYTLTVNGVKHLWGMTAYNGATGEALKDIIDHKNSLLDELYNSLPNNQKVM